MEKKNSQNFLIMLEFALPEKNTCNFVIYLHLEHSLCYLLEHPQNKMQVGARFKKRCVCNWLWRLFKRENINIKYTKLRNFLSEPCMQNNFETYQHKKQYRNVSNNTLKKASNPPFLRWRIRRIYFFFHQGAKPLWALPPNF